MKSSGVTGSTAAMEWQLGNLLSGYGSFRNTATTLTVIWPISKPLVSSVRPSSYFPPDTLAHHSSEDSTS